MQRSLRIGVTAGAALAVPALALTLLTARPAGAQTLRTALGLTGGLVAGVHVATGIFVLRSRAFGHEMHTAEDLVSVRPETAPILLMPLAGAVVGHRSSSRLAGAATWGGVGLVTGAALGAGIGHLIWGSSGGRWSGGTIGSAAGLAIGSILGAALTSTGDRNGENGIAATRYLTFSLPVGPWR